MMADEGIANTELSKGKMVGVVRGQSETYWKLCGMVIPMSPIGNSGIQQLSCAVTTICGSAISVCLHA